MRMGILHKMHQIRKQYISDKKEKYGSYGKTDLTKKNLTKQLNLSLGERFIYQAKIFENETTYLIFRLISETFIRISTLTNILKISYHVFNITCLICL